MGIHTGSPACMTAAMSGWTCTGRHGSPRRRTVARWWSPTATANLVARTPAPGVALRGPRQRTGSRTSPAGAPVPARVDGLPSGLPAVEDRRATVSSLPVPTTPLVGPTSCGARGGAALIAGGAAGDADRSGWVGKDPAGRSRSARELVDEVPGRRLLRAACRRSRPPEVMWTSIGEALDLRRRPSAHRRLLRACRRPQGTAGAGQPRAAGGRRRGGGRAAGAGHPDRPCSPPRGDLCHVAAEHEYALTPLDVPAGASLDAAQRPVPCSCSSSRREGFVRTSR